MVKRYNSANKSGHLVQKFAETSGKRTMVIGHRGGSFGPDNSMKCFQGAMDNDLEGIEFDVSPISKTKKALILRMFFYEGLDEQGLGSDGVAWGK